MLPESAVPTVGGITAGLRGYWARAQKHAPVTRRAASPSVPRDPGSPARGYGIISCVNPACADVARGSAPAPEDCPEMPDPTALPEGFFQRPLTGRQLSDFGQCPHRFLLNQFVSETDRRRFGGAGLVLYQGVRDAIVAFYSTHGGAEGMDQALQDQFARCFAGELCADALEEARTETRGRRMLDDFAADWIPHHPVASDTDVRFEITIDGQAFASSADLVFDDDNGTAVIRLNTRKPAPSPASLASDVSAGLLALATAARLGSGSYSVGYYSLAERRFVPIELTAEQAEHLQHDLVSRAARMRRETRFAPRTGRHCRWCPVRSRCGVWL